MQEESEAWTKLFFGIIPRHTLDFVFNETCRNYAGSYAPNAYDVLKMWRELENTMNETRRAAEEKEAFIRRVERCRNKAEHINADGDVMLAHPCNPMNEEYQVPCSQCRPTAYNDVRRRTIAEWNLKHSTVSEPLTTAVSAVVKEFPKEPPRKDWNALNNEFAKKFAME